MTEGPAAIVPGGSVILAPLSGYTDLPFRRSCRRHGCVLAFTPLVEVGSVVYRNPRVPSLLARGSEETWLGLQILGSDLSRIEEAVRRLESHPFDVIDFNLGCPVPKVTKRGAGAAMGRNPDFAAECIAAIVALSSRPVTAKIRILNDEDPAPTVHYARLLQAAGCRALTIHGRTWERVYSGPVACHVIAAVADALSIPVIANGGVFDAESAAALRRGTGCSRIMVARGAIGNPWIFEQIQGALPPAHEAVCAEVDRHIREMVEFHGEEVGMRIGRKIIAAYLGGRGYPRGLRSQVMGLSDLQEFTCFMDRVRQTGPTHGYQH